MAICVAQSLAGNDGLGLEGGEVIARAIRSSKITSLDVGDCRLGPGGAAAVLSAALDCTRLGTLALYSNRIGDDGALALSPLFPELSMLTALDLTDNNFGPVGVAALADGLAGNQSLTVLEIGRVGEQAQRSYIDRVLVESFCVTA